MEGLEGLLWTMPEYAPALLVSPLSAFHSPGMRPTSVRCELPANVVDDPVAAGDEPDIRLASLSTDETGIAPDD
jgi:hypothetical protein